MLLWQKSVFSYCEVCTISNSWCKFQVSIFFILHFFMAGYPFSYAKWRLNMLASSKWYDQWSEAHFWSGDMSHEPGLIWCNLFYIEQFIRTISLEHEPRFKNMFKIIQCWVSLKTTNIRLRFPLFLNYKKITWT